MPDTTIDGNLTVEGGASVVGGNGKPATLAVNNGVTLRENLFVSSFARMGALSVQGTMSALGAVRQRPAVIVATSSPTAISEDDSGAILSATGGATILTLPSNPPTGTNYTIVVDVNSGISVTAGGTSFTVWDTEGASSSGTQLDASQPGENIQLVFMGGGIGTAWVSIGASYGWTASNP